ncbi:MAG: Mov34/MPN/PAD-1 family protein [Methanomassiliicoccales archaeon]|jgi:proteasome lid subunit RPN8/RPN11
MTGERRKRVWGIEGAVIETINEAAKSSYPNEFVAALRAEKGVITEILLLPGTISGERSGLLQLHMLPIDFSVVGTVHSHPSFSNEPSDADLALFGRFGYIHIITCVPFDEKSWKAYDFRGNEVELEVI